MNSIFNTSLVVLFASFGFTSYAQEKIDVENYDIEIPNVPSQGKRYHAKITLTNGQKLKGVITFMGDSSIQLEKVSYPFLSGLRNPIRLVMRIA